MGIYDRFKKMVNTFINDAVKDTYTTPQVYGTSSSFRPDRPRMRFTNERSIITSIYTRISIDVASVDIRHVRLDDQDRYLEDIDSGLNNCFTLEANIDQNARHFRQDIAMTLLDKGVIAIVPVDTSLDPNETTSFDILTVRVGEVVHWFPRHVKVSLYNDRVGIRQEIVLPKSRVAIVENPFYNVMNEPNSTLQRLIRKLNFLDAVDEQSASGKLDLIIQLPYVIKSDARREQAEKRRQDIEFQLKGSQYGIAYTDGTEKITQLNRPAENNLLKQIEYLIVMLYGQLGITAEIMNGTADEKATLNYWNRTVEPIINAVVEECKRKFLTKTARSQQQSIEMFRNPFKLMPIGDIAEIADKFARNEILSSNEIRQLIGFKPSKDPKADQLVNSNMPQGTISDPSTVPSPEDPNVDTSGDLSQEDTDLFDSLDSELSKIFDDLGVDENDLSS